MIKKVLSYLSSFILYLSITSLTVLIILTSSILNKNYLIKKLEKNNYYTEVYNNIVENFENNLIQSGLDIEIVHEIIDKEEVKSDINIIIDGIYENKEIKIDETKVKDKLDSIINDTLQKNNRIPSSEEKQDILTLENAIGKIYKDEIAYSVNIAEEIGHIYKYVPPLVITLISLLCAVTLTILVLLLRTKEKRHKVDIALLASGLTLIIIYLFIGSKYQGILILNKAFSSALIYITKDILTKILLIGVIYSIISVISTIIKVIKNS